MRTQHLCRAMAVVVLVGFVYARPAAADPVAINFSLTATSVFGDMRAVFGLAMSPGTTFAGRLTYDPNAPDTASDPAFGQYFPAGSVSIDFGTGMTLPIEFIVVQDDAFNPQPFPVDEIEATGRTQSFPGFESAMATIRFRGAGQSDALPQDAAAFLNGYRGLAGMHFSALQIGVSPPFDMGTHEFFATALLEDAAPVPEPGTLMLVAGGIGLLARRYRRRALRERSL